MYTSFRSVFGVFKHGNEVGSNVLTVPARFALGSLFEGITRQHATIDVVTERGRLLTYIIALTGGSGLNA
jgi:hypothetical protein